MDAAADALNGRPRTTLDWSKPIKVYAEHLARLALQPGSVHWVFVALGLETALRQLDLQRY